MPPSSRVKGKKETRRWFREEVRRALAGFQLEEREWGLNIEYHGKWYNNDGSIKRRDLPNLSAFLSDDVAEALGIDDKCWFDFGQSKVESGEEFVRFYIARLIP